jgi:hypothetical protein
MRPFLLVLLAITFTSCQALRNAFHRQAKDAAPTTPAGASVVGAIEMVNPDAQFVIVRMNSSAPIAASTELISVDAEGKQTKLKVTPERKGLFVTADVVQGTAHQGDIVVRTAEAAAAAKAESAAKLETPTLTEFPGTDITVGQRPTISISPGSASPSNALPLPTPMPNQGEFLRVVPPPAR